MVKILNIIDKYISFNYPTITVVIGFQHIKILKVSSIDAADDYTFQSTSKLN